MLSQIWSVKDIIFYFRPFFALLPHYWSQKVKLKKNVKNPLRSYLFTHVYHKSRSYDVWFLGYKVQRAELFVILSHFCPFTPLTTQKIKTLKNKIPADIAFLHLRTTNDDHMMYGSWDIEHDRQNFLSFWAIFAVLPP